MLEVKFQFQSPEEAAAAIQAISALANGISTLTSSAVALPTPLPVTPPPVAVSPTTPAVPTAPTPAEPTHAAPVTVPVAAAPTFTREQIMTAGAALIDAGKMNELTGLLNNFGVQAVTQLKQEQLGAFATELRKLGAQI